MDAEGATRHPEAERFWHVSQKSGDLDRRARDGESWRTVAVFLSGGAPWGFTLRGGLEHREPLIITKVEEGSKAAAVSLQVGDELININEIPLSGYRQEAICLVKGSHKTLSLVVKRRNEPISRPHSWHSTKFNESQSEAGRRQSPPTAVWHPRYDASSSSSATDLTSGWEQTNLHRVSDQFSSHGSMDSLEQVPHSYPGGQMSPAKSNNSMEHLGGGKRDSAYSSFSTSSSTPDYSLSRSNAASTENVAYKGQWDAGAKHSNGRNSQSFAADGGRQDERLAYFQMPGVDSGHSGPHTGDSPGSRHSSSSRTSFGPVWNVPEKKRTVSASPPPPLPPARSDSFAATKAHERGVKTHPEGPDSHLGYKVSAENHHSHNISPKSDSENDYVASDKGSHSTSGSNKQYSFYSSDVGQQHVPHASQLFHPRQHADKSTFHPQAWPVSAPKPQNAGGYHCSSQEPPANGSTQHSSQNHRRSLSASLSSTTTNQITETTGPSRYYCVTASNQPNASSWSDLPNDRRSGAGIDPSQTGPEQTVPKVKYQHHPSHNKDSNAYSKPQVTTVPETSVLKHFFDDKESQRGHSAHMADPLHLGNLPRKQPEQRRSLPAQLKDSQQDIRLHSQASNQFSPQATPMLHSLSIDVEGQEEKSSCPTSEESLESKQVKRSERFATTLRNEIQMRRARLQKSRSAAALPGVEGEAEDQDLCISTKISTPTSADGSFSNTYKHDLKEAQARVLKATSFRRRDLERVVLEYSVGETQNNHQPSTQARKDVDPLATATESGTNHSSGHVTRIGSRKRFPPEKKVRSYSEPNKLYEIGVNEGLVFTENATSSLDHQKNLNETMKPGFPDSMPPKSQLKYQGKDQASSVTTEDTKKEIKSMKVSYPTPSCQDKQRLDTFAEYEASWKIQSKHPDEKASGRYRSADNILDPGPEDRTQRKCFHERSRSSPTADMYGQPHLQKIPVPETKRNTDYSQTKNKPAETLVAETRFSDTSSGDCKEGEKAAEIENYLAPPPPLMTGANPDCRQRSTAAATKNHKSVPISPSPTEPEEHSHTEPLSWPGKKPSPTKHQEINSQKSFTGSQSDVLTQCSPNFEPYPTFYPPSSANTDSEQGKGLMDKEQGAVHHPSTSNPQLASSPPASSHRPSGLFSMEGQRSPSPQFSPQKLSDKPPVSLHEDESSRVEHLIENQNTAARKVPIRIVHSEGSEEKENSPFLQQSDLPHGEAEGQSVARFSALPALGQDSVFCAFTRQKEPEDTEMQRAAQGDPYMITVGDHLSSNSEEPSSQRETTGLNEQEDQKREELARDIMGKDKSLADILDQRKMRTTMDLMEGIFPQGQQLLDGAHQRRKVQTKQTNSRSVEEREKEDNMAAAMVTSSTYYSTSAPKAELLIKMKDMQEEDEEEDSEDELDIGLNNKKQELIDSLSKKLQVLREAKESLLEDILDNNTLGDEVEAEVQQVCRPNELEKFRMFVGDLDKVVSLLLSLSGRLARVENALNNLEGDATPEERRTLIEKRKLLIRQHEDAKELKENLDRRERIVFDILASYLPKDSLADYEHFVKMKSALIIEQRKLEDKIKLGEEQLKCLIDSLPIEQRLVL